MAQKCSEKDLTLLLADKRKLFRDSRAESQLQTIPENTSKKQKQVVALK